MIGATALDLKQSIQSKTFVPFLGAGATTLRQFPVDLSRPPWDCVGAQLELLSRQFADDSLERKYIDSFIEGYGLSNPKSTGPQSGPPSSSREAAVLRLQVALVKLAVRLLGVVGEQILERRPPFSVVPGFKVKCTHSTDEELLIAFTEGIFAAHELEFNPRKPPSDPEGFLRGDRIARKLGYLGSLLLLDGPQSTRWQSEFGQSLPTLPSGDEGFGNDRDYVRADEISWLSELLWFTLRYKVPEYPTASELSMPISLAIETLPPRTGDLSLAADFSFDSRALPDIIRSLFVFCEDGSRNPKGEQTSEDAKPRLLHHALAMALESMYDRFQAEHASFESVALGGFPVAFTTNYDRELERAFDARKYDYHVLFPISGKMRAAPTRSPLWGLKTVRFKRGREVQPTYAVIPREDTVCPFPPEGPIIVKLHGSPLEPLGVDRKLGNFTDLEHELVIAESHYLRNIIGEFRAGPIWMTNEISSLLNDKPRHLWFLGYSISDWNIRLLLYEQVSDLKTGAPRSVESVWRGVVNQVFDPFREAFLKKIDVAPFPGDLMDFARELLSLEEVQQMERESQ